MLVLSETRPVGTDGPSSPIISENSGMLADIDRHVLLFVCPVLVLYLVNISFPTRHYIYLLIYYNSLFIIVNMDNAIKQRMINDVQ